jgi:hypothetical protein
VTALQVGPTDAPPPAQPSFLRCTCSTPACTPARHPAAAAGYTGADCSEPLLRPCTDRHARPGEAWPASHIGPDGRDLDVSSPGWTASRCAGGRERSGLQAEVRQQRMAWLRSAPEACSSRLRPQQGRECGPCSCWGSLVSLRTAPAPQGPRCCCCLLPKAFATRPPQLVGAMGSLATSRRRQAHPTAAAPTCSRPGP